MAYLNITLRIVSIMGILLILVIISGRRKIGELPVFDFLTIIILGNVVGADIADPEVPHFPTVYAVVLLIGIQYYISYLTVKNRKIGSKLTFEPVVVIQDGQFIKSNMEKVRYSIENIMMFLRQNGIFDIEEVEFAIVEDSGNISIQKKPQYQPLTPSDMNITTSYKGITCPLIIDGTIYDENLQKLELNRTWLETQLRKNGIHNLDEVFYVDINPQGRLHISKKNDPEKIYKFFKI